MSWAGRGIGQEFNLETNLFYILSSNEILPYEIEAFPGRAFYENTGKLNVLDLNFWIL